MKIDSHSSLSQEPHVNPRPAGLTTSTKQRVLVRETPKAYVWFAWFLKGSAAAYLIVLISMIFFETRLVFPGASTTAGDWSHSDISLEEVDFLSRDGTKLYGYFFPNPMSDRCILFCHGNGENIAMNASEMDVLRKRLNASVFVFDYRGFGKSQGTPWEEGIFADAEAASQWLANRSQQSAEDQIIMGRSLGGGVAVHLAALLDPKAIILDRTFSSAVEVAAERYWWLPVRIVMRNQFWSSVKIKKYSGPLLQMHGDADESIPMWSAKKLFLSSPSEDKTFIEIPGLTHNQAWQDDLLDKLKVFLERLDNDESLEIEDEPVDIEMSEVNGR